MKAARSIARGLFPEVMRALGMLLVLVAGCTRASPVAEAQNATRGSRSPAQRAVPAPASAVPEAGVPAVPVGHFRLVNAKSGGSLELAPDGKVTGSQLPAAELGADGRLVVDGGSVFRIATNGEVLDGDEVFGRFVDDKTLSLDPNITLTIADDGKVTVTATTVDSVTGEKRVKVLGDGVVRVEADDARSRKLALFVLVSEGRATHPFMRQGHEDPKSKTASYVVAGAAALGVAALLGVGMYGDAKEHILRLQPLEAKVQQQRWDALDSVCAKGAARKGYRYSGGTRDDRAELARLESCEPLPGGHGNQYFCCLF